MNFEGARDHGSGTEFEAGGAGASGELGSFNLFVGFVLGILVTTLVSVTYHKCYKAKGRTAESAMYSRVHVDEEDEEDKGGIGESSTRPRGARPRGVAA